MKKQKTCGNCGWCDVLNDREGRCLKDKTGFLVVFLANKSCSFWKERKIMQTNKERPIIFSAEMVRAILEGRKTMTRRVIKEPISIGHKIRSGDIKSHEPMILHKGTWLTVLEWSPYGQIGDRLWVRETWANITDYDGNFLLSKKRKALYKADCESQIIPNKWHSPIYMPQWASRITLEITNIRVERIQDITEEDAKAEGLKESQDIELKDGSPCYTLPFQNLWTQIHGIDNPKSWEANPWCWVIEFKRKNNADK